MIAKVGDAESNRSLIDNLEGKLIDFQSQIQDLRQQKEQQQAKLSASAGGGPGRRGRLGHRGRGRGARATWGGRSRSWVAGQDSSSATTADAIGEEGFKDDSQASEQSD